MVKFRCNNMIKKGGMLSGTLDVKQSTNMSAAWRGRIKSLIE